jgi:hypothetical protein
LTPPSGKRGPPMTTGKDESELRAENERLRKENALQRELIAVLRELPGNRDRDVPPLAAQKEAGERKPRRKKSRAPQSVPGAAGVDSAPSS